ncbi:MAG: hypothetical protein AB7H77_09640 [Bdellovibrionales bacterium]
MNEPINIQEKILQRDARPYVKDESGIWFPYSISYVLYGMQFSLEVWARSDEEAQDVLKQIAQTGVVDGRIMGEA